MSRKQAFDGNMEKGDAMVNRQKAQDLALKMRSRVEQGKGDGEFKEIRRIHTLFRKCLKALKKVEFDMENDIQSRLLYFYKKRVNEDIEIPVIAKISDGWENDVYSFTTEYEQGGGRKRDDLILRIYPGDGARQKAAREFNGMQKLYELGFPVPEVFTLELDDSPFGKPFVIMEKINGRSMGQILDESPDEKRRDLATLLCEMFVDLHNLDWRQFVPDPSVYETGDPYGFVNQFLSKAQGYVERFQRTDFVPALHWLKERRSDVPCDRPSVVHLDYHPYNILMQDDGKPFVIDWTNIDIADFRFDLAWTVLLMSGYGNPEAREIVLDEYQRIAGRRIEHMEYFDVMASLKRLFSISVSISDGAGKLGMRPEAVTMMKRNVSHIKSVYSVLYDRTGVAIPEIESLIKRSF
jgi:aminoglycoside phosphotransferase (APT) family kinase protein